MKLGQLLRQIDDPSLSRDERARLRCDLAKRLEEGGDYKGAAGVMGELWPSFDERPAVEGLEQGTSAEVLLRVGALIGWLGSSRQIADAQERAKNLISASVRVFEELGDRVKAAEALTDLAYCYWREGAFDEARLMLADALSRLGDDEEEEAYRKGVARVRSAIVEKEATRYGDALRILTESAPLFERIESHALKGKFHNELATVLKDLGAAENREDYMDRALVEYAAASFHFEQAGHDMYHACVENNLGFLYSMVGRYPEAHEHLNSARRLMVSLKDNVHVAQVDETRARVMLAEGRPEDAERVASVAVEALDQGGHQHLLAEALTTHGTALARAGRGDEARLTLKRAAELAEQAGDPEGAGHALLTAIEELADLFSARDLGDMYVRASELLAKSQYPATRARLAESGEKVVRTLKAHLEPASGVHGALSEEFKPSTGWRNFNFWTEVRRYEAYLITLALREAKGVVTRAAQLLGFRNHGSLNSLLKGRHKALLHLRTPVEPRRRTAFRIKAPRRTSKCRVPTVASPSAAPERSVKILYVEDNHFVSGAVKETLEHEGWGVDLYEDGATALSALAEDTPYDLLIFDNEVPGLSGLELIKQARRHPHRRKTPIIMFSASPCEAEARRRGADVFLRKPEDTSVIAETAARLLSEKIRRDKESTE